MPAVRQAPCPGEKTRRVFAFALLAQWLLLLTFSSSERLHQAVCDGAKKPSHDCAFVSVAKGHLWSSLAQVAVPAPSLVEGFVFFAGPVVCHRIADLRLMPDRGPPAGILLT